MKLKNVVKSLLMVLCFSLFFLGCGEKKEVTEGEASNATQQIHFTDLKGREITLDKPAERIFLGFYEESYLAVAKDFSKVVSISRAEWADFFTGQYMSYEEQMPSIKDMVDTGSIYKGSFSMETILNSRPEVAILAPFQYETLAENIQKLEDSGIKVVVIDYNSQTLENHMQSTRILGMVTGNEERAEQLALNYEKALKEVADRVAKVEAKKRTYVELGNLGPHEIGNSYGNYLWGSLVKSAGGNNIGEGKIESYGPLDPEYILSSNPEMILFAGSRWSNDAGDRVLVGFGVKPEETSARLKPYLERAGWDKLDAVKNGQVFAVDHGGLRSIYDYVYIQFIAKSLYPDLFEDIDPVKNLEMFYTEYLPIKPTGTFMTQYQK
ncbi:ABC transporter substrate-binding protein [Fusobacterium gonidiaformans]|uniref:ABC transporter substrate-binding protein n=1 Tax=Fusobacterium gonidiaformans TaxID=849 RepID=UPI00307F1CF3